MIRERAFHILRTPEFRSWFDEQTEKSRVQIDDRLSKIQDQAYFGDHKSVSKENEVYELRWKNGRRLYFSLIADKNVLILLGGNKNGQEKDINKAKSLYKKYTA